jgi:3-deoxy-D-manno-octulosonate 8-phosphate phosphatase (KDO 8-P phosphatase)
MTSSSEKLQAVKLIITDVDGVLTDGRIGMSDDGRQTRVYTVQDGMGLALWHTSGGKSAILSGNGGDSITNIAKQWSCTVCVTHSNNKLQDGMRVAEQCGVSLEEVAFIGDDIIDLELIKAAGIGVAVSNVASSVCDAADMVTERGGGEGALRELIESILSAQGKLDTAIAQYLCNRANPDLNMMEPR